MDTRTGRLISPQFAMFVSCGNVSNMSAAEKAIYRPAAEAWFAEAIRVPRKVADICLFTQAGAGAPFTIAERFPLRG